MVKIAFLGTGIMGREMARRLIDAGHDLTVYNRTAAHAAALAEAGARLAESPAEAARDADMIISMVSDDDASRMVWLGPRGVLAGTPKPGTIAVESATLSRAWVLELDAALRQAGLRFVDCPVTGGPDGARAGRLTLLVGTDEETLEAARPPLSAYADRILRFGPPGCGTAYKLIVNLMGAVQAVALAEGLLAAERVGLDMDRVAEALTTGTAASPLVQYLTPRMVGDDHDDIYFTAANRLKDARYGLALAAELHQAMPVGTAAAQAFETALARGWGEKNSSVVIDALR